MVVVVLLLLLLLLLLIEQNNQGKDNDRDKGTVRRDIEEYVVVRGGDILLLGRQGGSFVCTNSTEIRARLEGISYC